MVRAPHCALLAVGGRKNLESASPTQQSSPGWGEGPHGQASQEGKKRAQVLHNLQPATPEPAPCGVRVRILQGGGPAPQCAQARAALGSDRSSALGGHRLASQVGRPQASGSDRGVRDPILPRTGRARALVCEPGVLLLPSASSVGQGLGRRFGRAGAKGGLGGVRRAGRVQGWKASAVLLRPRSAGWERGGFVYREMQLRVFH